ncbi:MAG: HAMP domain-containing histidine kinase [Lachnospiraceae bacterium]|nr:HAMP domain-containing histidine kinase [Lachnospiraceae bacterium]
MKKSHKLTTIIITLCILIPAFLLVSLYPRVRKVMNEEKARIEKLNQELEEKYGDDSWDTSWHLTENFVNYAMESTFYLYSTMVSEERKETGGKPLDFQIFEEYGWLNDYHTFRDNADFEAIYRGMNGEKRESDNENLEGSGAYGYLSMVFNSNGYLESIELDGDLIADLENAQNLYDKAMDSAQQFKNNVGHYNDTYGLQSEAGINAMEYMPKNFSIKIAIIPSCNFVYSEDEYIGGHYYNSYEGMLLETGALFVIFAAAILVALMALLLPFFKKLETGWDKLFRVPFEFVLVLLAGGIGGAFGMFYAMAYTCGMEYYPALQLLGFPISERTQYVFLLVMYFLGWAVVFFMEYIVVASLRQFLCGPKLYIHNRVLFVRFLRWLKRQCVRLYNYVTHMNLNEKLNRTVMKIVLANFGLVTVVYSLIYWFFGIVFDIIWYDGNWYFKWFIGIFAIVGYSAVLYILLLKYGTGIQKQYHSVLHATEQMAEGNLKISLEEDLGVFQPIGDSLNEVQKGFEKAVVEEAKSQNMKTELITNVSHDLKTPLTAIITYVDLLKKEDITEEERKSYVQTLDQKSQRLKVLIEDLFEVSKAQSGNVTMNYLDVDVVNLMKQVRMEMEDQMEASDLTFRWNLPEEKIILSLDGQRTYRIFENLLNNALKYAMPHSRVYVDILDSTADVKIVFRNISAQELDFDAQRLTERFVRGDASRNSEGSGLGLAIAKSFTELQNGKMNIEVDGDLFKVTLIWTK